MNQDLPRDLPTFPFWIGLFCAVGSLLVYFIGAILARLNLDENVRSSRVFNLGLPAVRNYEDLFGISIAAASCPLSTVFFLFFTTGRSYGIRLFLCPIMFGLGTLLMFWVYRKTDEAGYFVQRDQSSEELVGLIPYLVERLSGSSFIGRTFLALCILPMIGLLSLEIGVGTHVIGYITSGTLHFAASGDRQLLVFVLFVLLLLGYVFVGGFRAVIASDIWQYKIIMVAVLISLSTFLITLSHQASSVKWNTLWFTSTNNFAGFYVQIFVVNLIAPVGLATSWQRFRAFSRVQADLSLGIRAALRKTVLLWGGLIATSLCIVLLATNSTRTFADTSLSDVFTFIQQSGDWCQFLVFPLLLVGALSAMYSTSDTCVSALLYLLEYPGLSRSRGKTISRRHYYAAMTAILSMTLVLHWILKKQFIGDTISITSITSTPLWKVGIATYANLSVIAPTLFLMTLLPPASDSVQAKRRTKFILSSILLGSAAFWFCTTMGFLHHGSLWDAVATVPALIFASLPLLLLYRLETQGKETVYGRGNSGVSGAWNAGKDRVV
jgi:hypothetical protein